MSFDPTVLFLGMVISSVGLGLFVYGKKQARLPQLVVGLALMVFPYFAGAPRVLVSTAALLLLALWWALRLGW
jgi:hypothetical protein